MADLLAELLERGEVGNAIVARPDEASEADVSALIFGVRKEASRKPTR